MTQAKKNEKWIDKYGFAIVLAVLLFSAVICYLLIWQGEENSVEKAENIQTPEPVEENKMGKIVVTEFNQCKEHADCGPTCCGCYNQAFFQECGEGCDGGSLKPCGCLNGICTPTGGRE